MPLRRNFLRYPAWHCPCAALLILDSIQSDNTLRCLTSAVAVALDLAPGACVQVPVCSNLSAASLCKMALHAVAVARNDYHQHDAGRSGQSLGRDTVAHPQVSLQGTLGVVMLRFRPLVLGVFWWVPC